MAYKRSSQKTPIYMVQTGKTRFNQLNDVNLPLVIPDNSELKYDATTEKWILK